jgi:arylsulfatase A-like enzyme
VGWHTPNPPENLTPRLHALAQQGIILERQYNHFTCTPSRSAFTTGRLPVHVQTTLDNPDSIASGIPVNMTALPLKLRAAGYSTNFIGKCEFGAPPQWAHKHATGAPPQWAHKHATLNSQPSTPRKP